MKLSTVPSNSNGRRQSVTYSDYIPIICGCLYAAQGIIMLAQGQHGFALMWSAYALANIGIIIAAKGTS